jgi:hypothetical protein
MSNRLGLTDANAAVYTQTRVAPASDHAAIVLDL